MKGDCAMSEPDITLQKYAKAIYATALLMGVLIFAVGIEIQRTFAQSTQDTVDSRKAQLENELSGLEKEIEAQQKILSEKQREKVSLERDVAILDAQISEAQLSIKVRNLTIQKLGTDIGVKEQIIGSLSDKIDREKESLAQLIRKTNEIDSFSLVEVVLSNEDLSAFFIDLDSFDSIKASLQESFNVIETAKNTTTQQRDALEEKKIEEVELRTIQELQKGRIEEKRTERNKILAATKGQEKAYQQILKDKEKTAAAIRAELFALRDSAAIPFGKAVEYATRVGAKTGVRPAFILSILTQESNLGENTGQCFVKDLRTGSGVGKNTGRSFATVMKSPRDTEPFAGIAARVGFDPLNTAVSCPPSYGYGGAMGPAQFIPSTWVLYEAKIANLTGHNPPNPWDPEDAFMAAALLLKDNGAAEGGYTAERLAALRYFAGWKNASNPAYAFYGNDVMEIAVKLQAQINILQAS
ncbi:MAG: lytic murein transglycosylase [Patescibacteria group bacterium]|nr:lytic murein transglycosylase [Patescibacteria group bacterium]